MPCRSLPCRSSATARSSWCSHSALLLAVNLPHKRHPLQVIRDGKEQLVSNLDVVVGDVMVLDTGDKIVADGYVITVSCGRVCWQRAGTQIRERWICYGAGHRRQDCGERACHLGVWETRLRKFGLGG